MAARKARLSQSWPWGARLLLGSCGLPLLGAGAAQAQACPPGPVAVNGTSCVVPLGSTITVISAATPGLRATNPGGQISANSVTINLGPGAAPRNYIGAEAVDGGVINFDGSTLATVQAATGQRGLVSSGAGSHISANGANITLGTGAVAVTDNLAILASGGGTVFALAANVATLGGGNGSSNHAVVATGTGSRIDLVGGTVSTASRGSFGVLAQGGGTIVLADTTQVTTSGAQIVAGNIGSHALLSTGAGSTIIGTGITLSTTGAFASAARAEIGGSISLAGSTLTTSGTSSADTDPASAIRVLSGGSAQVVNSTITTTGQRGTGISVEGAGSQATVSGTTVTAAGTRANAVFLFTGGTGSFSNSSLSSAGPNAVLVQDAGSAITLTNTQIQGTGGAAVISYGLRVINGATATMTGGSSSTNGRDSPGITAAGGGTVTATNVAVRTSGNDNAMGVIADLNGSITLNGGSVETTGGEVRAGARPHGLVGRNPGGVLTATGTSVTTSGFIAMGVVADDGGTVTISNNRITTSGVSGIGLFSVTEQTGAEFVANLTASNLVLETSGNLAHGVTAQSRNDISAPKATATVNDAAITTRGNNAVGLRAVLGDYGTRPITGRGEAAVIANRTTVLTVGESSHGTLSRDNPTSVTMNQTSVLATGATAHGSVAEAGGLIIGNQASVTATGAQSAALFVIGAPGAVSNAQFTDSTLTNVSGPTIGVAGNGNVSLTGSTAGGSGEWLRVGSSLAFPPLTQLPPLGGVPDLPDPDPDLPLPGPLPGLPPPTALPVVPGLANVTVTRSTVTGSAFTAPGSVSNVTLVDSTWIMTGNSNLTNLVNDPSLIQYTPPGGDPTLLASYKTLTVVNYLGEGGQLGLNTFLGNDSAPSDRLIIDGGRATGSSPLLIANTTGAGDLTRSNGILVVDAINGGTTATGAFTLGRPVVAGPYEYLLFRSSVDASGPDNWYLRSHLNPGPDDPVPNFRQETSLYAALPAMQLIYGRTLIDSLHERVGELRPLEAPAVTEERTIWCKNPEKNFRCTTVVQLPASATAPGRSYASSGWARIIGQHSNHDGGPGGIFRNGPSYDYDLYAFQAGLDLYRSVSADGSRDHAGIYGAIGRIEGDVTHFNGIKAGTNSSDAYSLGAYWTHFGPSGWYLDGVLQGTWYDAKADSKRGFVLNRDTFGFAASLEGGYPLQLGNGFILEPQAQLVYQTVAGGSALDTAALVRFSDAESLAGRIGARLAKSWTLEEATPGARPRLMTAWLKASLWNEFLGNPKTSFSSATGFIPFRSDLGGAWAELKAGIDAQLTRNTALYATAGYSIGFDGRSHAYDGRLGIKVSW
ncbi:autotransporter outer membrane beta-barrel domain-containing protein [Bosea sp. 2YAB26]|uniref:autotransporter outer membrane beta-barrel domain-containing protein n=2 Tax=Pseudomonadota TaxID=1224 RepID=UPI003F8E4ECC